MKLWECVGYSAILIFSLLVTKICFIPIEEKAYYSWNKNLTLSYAVFLFSLLTIDLGIAMFVLINSLEAVFH